MEGDEAATMEEAGVGGAHTGRATGAVTRMRLLMPQTQGMGMDRTAPKERQVDKKRMTACSTPSAV